MYSIIELQTTGGQTAHVYQTAETKDEAMSKFHLVLASAAISTVEHHVCVVLDENGMMVAHECYHHTSNNE